MLFRFIGPVAFLGIAGWVYWYNATHLGSMVVFPQLERVPGIGPDLARQGQMTWTLLLVVGLLWFVGEVAVVLIRRRRQRQAEAED